MFIFTVHAEVHPPKIEVQEPTGDLESLLYALTSNTLQPDLLAFGRMEQPALWADYLVAMRSVLPGCSRMPVLQALNFTVIYTHALASDCGLRVRTLLDNSTAPTPLPVRVELFPLDNNGLGGGLGQYYRLYGCGTTIAVEAEAMVQGLEFLRWEVAVDGRHVDTSLSLRTTCKLAASPQGPSLTELVAVYVPRWPTASPDTPTAAAATNSAPLC